MPRPAKKSRSRTENAVLSDELRTWLCYGRETNPEGLRSAWRTFRDEVSSWWADRHPGSRCWGWWRWDAPKPADVVHVWIDDAEHHEQLRQECAELESMGQLRPGERAAMEKSFERREPEVRDAD